MADMTDLQFVEALNDCINRMNEGESLESCLAAYPQYAKQLEGLLQTGDWVHQATYNGDQVAEAKARTRQRIRETLKERRQSNSKPKQSKPKPRHFRYLPYVAGLILIVGFGVIVALALLGPSIGGTFSDISSALDGGGGANQAPAQMNATVQAPIQVTANAASVAGLPTTTASTNVQQQPTMLGQVQATGTLAANISETLETTPAPSQPPQATQAVQATSIPMTLTGVPQSEASEATAVAMITFPPPPSSTPAPTATPTFPPPPSSTPIPSPTVDAADALSLPPEEFLNRFGVNPFYFTADDNLSTFAMDVDTASYTLTRNYLRDFGQLPPAESIRPEEFINYFEAGYEPPQNPDEAFAIHLDAAPAPFGMAGDQLLRVGIQGRQIAPEDRDPALLIFVIDVSGSMNSPQKLGLVKESLAVLVDELREDDRVGIVVYADNTQPILNPTPASEKETILAAIDSLQSQGSTYAEAGLRLGYQMAEANMQDGEITRIILLSDGVANVGETGPDAILQRVSDGVEAGITLSTIGFGMGEFNDFLMERLANDGNGNYFYIDNIREARRIFVNNLTSTLQVIGYDAKVQVEFSPEAVERYRLIGYENRAVADVDFRNDTVDAGEVGAGHSITALYEMGLFDPSSDDVIATAYIRYQDAETREVVEISQTMTAADIVDDIRDTPPSFRLQVAAAEFAERLRNSFWAREGSYGAILGLLEPLTVEYGGNPQLDELAELVRLAIQYGDQ